MAYLDHHCTCTFSTHCRSSYHSAPASAYIEADQVSLLKICFYGMCWGTAQALFGLSIESIGVALGFSIVLGVSAAMGTLIPFVRLHPAMLLQQTGAMLFSGLGLVVFGVSFCALAGRR